jgi:hypothetical protein
MVLLEVVDERRERGRAFAAGKQATEVELELVAQHIVVTRRTLLAKATGVTRVLVTSVRHGYRNHILSTFYN